LAFLLSFLLRKRVLLQPLAYKHSDRYHNYPS